MTLLKSSVICIGETVIDYIAEVFELPHKNQTVFVRHMSRSIGGGSANVAIMLCQTGVNTSLLSFGGDNLFSLMETISQYPLDLSLFKRIEGNSPSVFIYFCGNEYMTFFDPGTEDEFPFAQELPDISSFSVLCLVGSRLAAYRQFYSDILRDLDISNKAVVFCPAWSVELFSTERLREIIRKTTILVVNQQEYRAICRHLKLSPLSLLDEGPQVVIETCGAEGCVVFSKQGLQKVPAISNIPVINPSGAGDAFIAGLIFGLLNDHDYIESAQLGSTLASFVLEVPQSHTSIEVDKFLNRWKVYFPTRN